MPITSITPVNQGRPILYVGEEEASKQAQELLREAGFEVDVRPAPSQYRVAYGTPVLFALSNRFEGVEGVRVFIENAKILGHPKPSLAHS